jgi:hypothetical protein
MDALTMFGQLGLTVVPGPRLIPGLIAAKVTRLVGKRRATAS